MANVKPFRAICFDNTRVTGAQAAAPPYDILTPELKEELYRKSPYNIARIDAGIDEPGDNETQNKYTRARQSLEKWLDEGVFKRTAEPCFYAYRMRYEIDGRQIDTTGFYAIVELVELGRGVYPHEATHSKPKADRLALMSATEANTSPIFSIYREKDGISRRVFKKVSSSEPYLEARDLDGTLHSMWPVSGPEDNMALREALSGTEIFIADGHHRYETAYHYFINERGGKGPDSPHGYVLMFLSNIEDGGLTILPTHRLVKQPPEDMLLRLKEHFSITAVDATEDITKRIAPVSGSFGLYHEGVMYKVVHNGAEVPGLSPAMRGLDVSLLDQAVFKGLLEIDEIYFEMDWRQARALVDAEEYGAAFFLRPTSVDDVERTALLNERMPPKSTYFYPKVMTGFVLNSLKDF